MPAFFAASAISTGTVFLPEAEKINIISFSLGVYLLNISPAIPLIFSILLDFAAPL